MVRALIHDPLFLACKSEPATKADLPLARDLLDTLIAHHETCVGMAANMIGIPKRIIVFRDESTPSPAYTLMFNPEIIDRSGPYETEESCLSLLGGPRKCLRYRTIRVQFQDEKMKVRTKIYHGWTAQIIQHEIDHCNGILI